MSYRSKRWLLVSVVLLAAAVQAGAQTSAPFGVITDRLQALFPKVEGDVVEARGGEITLSIGKRDGLQPGVELSVVREGRELRHPKTGVVLGRAEEDVARVVVSQVQEAYSSARVVRMADGQTDVRVGDHARVSAGKIPLTLLTLSSGVKDAQIEVIVQDLTEEINRTGRFQLSMGDALAVKIAEAGVKPDEVLDGKGITTPGQRPAFEYLLAVVVKRVQNKPYVDARVFSSASSAPLMTAAMFAPPSLKPAPRERFSSDARSRPETASRHRSFLARLLGGELEAGTYSSGEGSIPLKEIGRFGFPILAMDVSVSPNDGIPHVVLTDGDKIFQYRIVNQTFEPEWTFSERGFGTIVSVQLVDLDGDGTFYVVANRWDPKAELSSFVLTAKDRRPRYVVESTSSILFAVDEKGDGVKRTLWAQSLDRQKFFTPGDIAQVTLRAGKLVTERSVRVPNGFRATGATYATVAKDQRVLAFIDEFHRLQIASADIPDLWRSASDVGGGGPVIELLRPQYGTDRSYFYRLEPTPLAIDLDGDGIDEIVMPQNVVKDGLLGVVFKGPAGFRFQSLTSGFEGVITALGGFRTADAAQPTLVAAVVRWSNSFVKKSGETQIIMTLSE